MAYRVYYFHTYVDKKGIERYEMRNRIMTADSVDKILNRYNVYYLTDLNGRCIIDNRKGVNDYDTY